uniref:Agenet-like domain-containing protein n=1 Tax=Macrostomum lignano TaxID=282301 RepID=A0A1I8JQG7_9PLAT
PILPRYPRELAKKCAAGALAAGGLAEQLALSQRQGGASAELRQPLSMGEGVRRCPRQRASAADGPARSRVCSGRPDSRAELPLALLGCRRSACRRSDSTSTVSTGVGGGASPSREGLPEACRRTVEALLQATSANFNNTATTTKRIAAVRPMRVRVRLGGDSELPRDTYCLTRARVRERATEASAIRRNLPTVAQRCLHWLAETAPRLRPLPPSQSLRSLTGRRLVPSEQPPAQRQPATLASTAAAAAGDRLRQPRLTAASGVNWKYGDFVVQERVFAGRRRIYMYPEHVTACEGKYALAVQALGAGCFRSFFREKESGRVTTVDYCDLTADA